MGRSRPLPHFPTIPEIFIMREVNQMHRHLSSMKLATAMYMAALLLAPGVGIANQGEIELPANKPNSTTFTFPMVLSPAARNCLDPDAEGVVIAHTFGNVENLQVIVHNMPPNTDFVLFIIQVLNAPFG